MLDGRLKFTAAEQRTEERRRQAYRIGWWLWLPVGVIMQAVLWFVMYKLFYLHSPDAWPMLGLALLITIGGIRTVTRHY